MFVIGWAFIFDKHKNINVEEKIKVIPILELHATD